MEDRSHASATRLPATQKPPSCDARALASSCKLQPSRARTRAHLDNNRRESCASCHYSHVLGEIAAILLSANDTRDWYRAA